MPLRLIVFAKAPEPGKAKTRLAHLLAVHGVARLVRSLHLHTLSVAQAAATELGLHVNIELCGSPGLGHDAWSDIVFPNTCHQSEQIDGDLRARISHAFDQSMAGGCDVLLFSKDESDLDVARLVFAAHALPRCDAVLQPVTDAGSNLPSHWKTQETAQK